MQNDRRHRFHRGRHQIVGERAGEKAAVRPVGEFLVQRRADGMREAAGDLPRHHAGMQDAAAVVHGDVFVDAHRAGGPIDLDAAEIEDEAVAQRGVDLVLLGRRRQFGRSPEHGFAQRLVFFRHQTGRPMAGGSEPRERHGIVGIAAGPHTAAGKLDLTGRDIELGGRHLAELVSNFHCGEMGGAADGGSKAAGIVAGGDRPGVARGVEI